MLKVFCPTTPANIKVRNKRDHTLSLCVKKVSRPDLYKSLFIIVWIE